MIRMLKTFRTVIVALATVLAIALSSTARADVGTVRLNFIKAGWIIGGAVGIFLAWVIGAVVTAWVFPTYLSVLAILGALGASSAAGVASGLFPAWKAARLDPIEALRAD